MIVLNVFQMLQMQCSSNNSNLPLTIEGTVFEGEKASNQRV